jgi:hypothetical protein
MLVASTARASLTALLGQKAIPDQNTHAGMQANKDVGGEHSSCIFEKHSLATRRYPIETHTTTHPHTDRYTLRQTHAHTHTHARRQTKMLVASTCASLKSTSWPQSDTRSKHTQPHTYRYTLRHTHTQTNQDVGGKHSLCISDQLLLFESN